jgi:hypothetical protein
MYLTQYLLFGILILLGLGAVIAFSYFVIKPVQTRWAVKKARAIVASGCLPSDWHFRNVYRMLATAHDDLEAAKLWRQLDGMQEAAAAARFNNRRNNHDFMQLVGIIPRTGKF